MVLGLACGLLLAACGQRGPLYLPTDAAAKGRATLPQIISPMDIGPNTAPVVPEAPRTAPYTAAPASAASSPITPISK